MKKEKLIGYKVVGKDLGSCTSVGKHDFVQYGIGILSRPKSKCGSLAVFTNRGSAVSFRKTMENVGAWESGWIIYRCKYIPSKKRYLKTGELYKYVPRHSDADFADEVELIARCHV